MSVPTLIGINLSRSHLVDAFGLIGIASIIFAETGLLIGVFLPGDSLLFTAGAAAAGALPQLTFRPNIGVLILVVIAAAIAGDQTGYLLGRSAGPPLFVRPHRRLLRPGAVPSEERFQPGRTDPSGLTGLVVANGGVDHVADARAGTAG